MTVKVTNVNKKWREIARALKDQEKNLNFYVIAYYANQWEEAVTIALQDLEQNPAAKETANILQNISESPNGSHYLDFIIMPVHRLGGLATQNAGLALCCLNLDDYDTMEQVELELYHLAWHALNDMDKQRRGRLVKPVQEREPEQLALENMQADIFSSFMMSMENKKGIVRELGKKRALASLEAKAYSYPEKYPFAIAYESTMYAINEYLNTSVAQKRQISTAMAMTRQIHSTYNVESIKAWLFYCGAAQKMAWRGYPKEEILTSAIYVSSNTIVRSLGHLISEMTAIKTLSVLDIRNRYSAFASNETNKELHKRTMDKVFEQALEECIKEHSARPLSKAANLQNAALASGNAFGWCANALISAAKTFEDFIANGLPLAESNARNCFDSDKNSVGWALLQELGSKIVRQHRAGNFIGLENIAGFCKKRKEFSPVLKAIATTLKDPEFSFQPGKNMAYAYAALQAGKAFSRSAMPEIPLRALKSPAPALGPTPEIKPILRAQRHDRDEVRTEDDDGKKQLQETGS